MSEFRRRLLMKKKVPVYKVDFTKFFSKISGDSEITERIITISKGNGYGGYVVRGYGDMPNIKIKITGISKRDSTLRWQYYNGVDIIQLNITEDGEYEIYNKSEFCGFLLDNEVGKEPVIIEQIPE